MRVYEQVPIAKCFDKILNNRLSWFMQYKTPANIFGFREKHDTNTLLCTLEHNLRQFNSEKKHSTILSIDLEKAYDRVLFPFLIDALIELKIGPNLIKTIHSFLINRRIFVRVNGIDSSVLNLHNGLPQGSPLSVTLFNIYIHNISESLLKINRLESLIYADNIILYASGMQSADIKIVQSGLNMLYKWTKVSYL